MSISPRLQSAVTRALTNSRRTQKESGKDILSGRDVKRIVDAAKEDGVTPDEVKLIVDQVGLALNADKLELGTSTRQRNFNKLFDKLSSYQNVPADTQGHVSEAGKVNWVEALTAKDEVGTETGNVPEKINLIGGVAAYERIANLLATSRRRPSEGGPSVVNLDIALEKAAPAQQEAVKAFYADIVADGQPATRANVFVLLDSRIAGLQMADVDGNSVLSTAELKGLDQVGCLAAELAKALAAREPVAAAAAHVFGEATGTELGGIIRNVSAEHKELSYSYARTVLFSELHNTKGHVAGVYTDRVIDTTGTPRDMDVQHMNTEHTFPKSHGVKVLAALSDLHHLFPTDDETNGRRASHPFGVVTGKVKFSKDESRLGLDPTGQTVFEPPDKHKGSTARALMYVATVYQLDINDVGGADLMMEWNAAYPPSDKEVARNAAVSKHQGNRNPFIDHPGLVDRMFQ